MEKYQTFVPRLFALIIDALIFLPLAFVEGWVKEANLPLLLFSIWLLISTMARPAYSIILHGLYGQTLGKMVLKVKVVDTFEKPITFHHAVLRELPNLAFYFSLMFFTMSQISNNADSALLFSYSGENFITTLFVIWGIADIAVFFVSDKRRALHDFIAGTIVIKTN